VTLDPFPFGGGITLSDSIRCEESVPFMTLPSLQEVHHIGAGIAESLSLSSDMTAGNLTEYVSGVIHLARDSRSRMRIQESMREKKQEVLRSDEAVEEWARLFQLLRKMNL
jgi:predicted O-linked N-acetylglucosamine transferase (SPINDLY family)